MTRWQWLLSQILRKLWLRASAYALLGVVTALIAIGAQYYLPWKLPEIVGADAVDSLLNIIASSMLAVTTFSLSTMTAAYSAATTNVTPRATKLLIEDTVSQRVLSTFVGSFLFSIVGIIVLKTGAYGPSGRSVLFIVTVIVVALVVLNLLRWIDHLTRLGRVGETTDRVESATKAALKERLEAPYLGGVPLAPGDRDIPDGAMIVRAEKIGHLQHIDMFLLTEIADAQEQDIYVLHNPGAFVSVDTPLAWMGTTQDVEGIGAEIRSAFSLAAVRSFEQDPRFGLAVMSEIGSRAMSSAINDPGTALDVIGRNTRLLAFWAEGQGDRDEIEPEHPRIHVDRLKDDDLFEDAFMLMARDGAGLIEIQLRLLKCLTALSRIGPEAFRTAARRQADMASARAAQALVFARDLERLEAAARK
ncbi:hypothetical protein XINFAN_04082 [Pseudogemmobacter humi]|uniref:DUF2254 domain-containing protein n=2 Tax=Pseudogemmobacter humi TaxID=2483812 RepID=A0A3P5XQA1_9RHOB|nr:hypothetical protein XINFAN_04082 [Pseudogemmobacter humi]